jgi:hypothetical protein
MPSGGRHAAAQPSTSRYPVSRERVRWAAARRPTVITVIGRKRDRGPQASDVLDLPIDLASRIGDHGRSRPSPAAPEIVRRVDGPIESDRSLRARPTTIGAEGSPAAAPEPARPPELPATVLPARPTMIGLEEIVASPVLEVLADLLEDPAPREGASAGPAIVTLRQAPLIGEMDLVVTPLPTPDDWHHFELALRRVPGVGPLRIEYYRAGILKLRLQWAGPQRFSEAVASVPGYRVGILGEDKTTVQIRVGRTN